MPQIRAIRWLFFSRVTGLGGKKRIATRNRVSVYY